jgi:hypothetical protein
MEADVQDEFALGHIPSIPEDGKGLVIWEYRETLKGF